MAEARKFVANKPAFLDRVREETLGNPSAGLAASNMSKAMPVLQEMKRSVELARGASFERCIELAYRRFHELFRDRILDLTHQFPADYVDEKTQEPFWSGAKRFPTPITFDPADPTHMGFLLTAANLYAVAFGLQPAPAGPETLVPLDSPLRDVARFEAVVRTLSPHEWAPSGKKLAARDEEAKGEDEVDRVRCALTRSRGAAPVPCRASPRAAPPRIAHASARHAGGLRGAAERAGGAGRERADL